MYANFFLFFLLRLLNFFYQESGDYGWLINAVRSGHVQPYHINTERLQLVRGIGKIFSELTQVSKS